jgi:hypothetical protein
VAESVAREATAESTQITALRRKAAATAERVRAMLDACPDTMIGQRDHALLALGFAGAFRRSKLVALRGDDLVEVADGFRMLIRRSKTDQAGEGQEIVISRLKIRPMGRSRATCGLRASRTGCYSERCTEAVTCVPGGCAGTMWR